MSFVSIEYLVLLLITFLLIHGTKSHKCHNLIILAASYTFYGWWNWRFLALVFGLSYLNFVAAICISRYQHVQRVRRLALLVAVIGSLATLAYFKYTNFFLESFFSAAALFGVQQKISLQIILPLGISFLTFQALAYTVDVWRGEQTAERDLVRFLAFLSFFPQLVAGPIERARELLPQFDKERILTRRLARNSIWLLTYGFFVKIVLADSLAPMVDSALSRNQIAAYGTILGTILFGLQIYCDFYGYSLIAQGSAGLLGFELSDNFRFPYWSTSLTEFWRRWHITLSTWLRDYLYIPLGGNRHGAFATYRNLVLTMLLGGLWHGASWNFVFWGLLHGIGLATWRAFPCLSEHRDPIARSLGWIATMSVVFVGWFLFRITDLTTLRSLVATFSTWTWVPANTAQTQSILSAGLILFCLEFPQIKFNKHFFPETLPAVIYQILVAILALSSISMVGNERPTFIYFQF